MSKVSKISGLLAVAVLAGGFALSDGSADAAGRASKTNLHATKVAQEAKVEVKGNILASAATILGVTEEALKTELHTTTGQTLAAIATKKGISQTDFVAKLVTAETARIDALATAGKITTEQATTFKTGLTERITYEVTKVHAIKADDFGKGLKGVAGNPLASAATLLGITEADLHTKLHTTTSATLATIAKDLKGWTAEEFTTKLIAAETARIDALVTAGTITTAQATAFKTGLTAKITAQVTKAHGANEVFNKDQKEAKGHKGGKGGRGH